MKKSKENWINPKTKKEEKIEVYEYSFEDWDNGRIAGDWKAGKRLVHNTTENKHFYEILPIKEYDKIEAKRKDLYWEKVKEWFSQLKKAFYHTHGQSGNRERLLESEIKRMEEMLFKSEYRRVFY